MKEVFIINKVDSWKSLTTNMLLGVFSTLAQVKKALIELLENNEIDTQLTKEDIKEANDIIIFNQRINNIAIDIVEINKLS